MTNILKGKINNIDTENRLAKVNINDTNNISASLCIPHYIDISRLKKETPVAFVVFDDNTGAIICELWSA